MPLFDYSTTMTGTPASAHAERSSVLDIRSLASAMDSAAAHSASASSVALPSFARPWTMPNLHRTSSPTPTPRPAPPRTDLTPLYLSLVMLSIIVALLGAHVLS